MPRFLVPAAAGLFAIALCLGSLIAAVALAQPAAAEKRVALVVGNADYTHASALANPGNDAGDMAEALKAVGVEVILGLNLDKRAFDAKVREFSRALAGADTGILFYAGHGLQVGQRNYLIPVDAQLRASATWSSRPWRSISSCARWRSTARARPTSCSSTPAATTLWPAASPARWARARSASARGWPQVQAGVGTFVAYATKPGDVALDGQGRNSPFTAALVKAVKTPGAA